MTVTFRNRVTTDALARFHDSVAQERPRVAKLLAPPREAALTPAELEEALDSLRMHHEELGVAEEELREQVDELTRMSIAIEAERGRYADLFSFAPDALVVTDRHGVIHEANEAAATLFNIERRFLRAKPFAAFFRADEGDALHGLLSMVQAEATPITLLMRPRGGGELVVDARVRATGRRDLLWVLRPLSNAATTEPSNDVERSLRDRTELLERERRRRMDLERSNRAKDRFIAVLAHDLRSPLNAIAGWAQLLERENMDRHGRARAVATIQRNAQMQAQLIEELLDVSRLDADKLALTLAPVDLGTLVERAVENLLPIAKENGIALTYSAAPDLVVIGDRPRLDQILGNVLSNALKYTATGGKVTVAAERDGDAARITVADTGKGIAPDLLPLVFDMYVQDRPQVTARRGLGLGLHIVKQLVELHDGTVRATSEGEGLGTTITICLPVHGERTPAKSERRLLPERELSRLHVLVIDDEHDERELVGAVLARAGAAIMCADGLGAAMSVFESWRPDVVVSDLAMPDADGCAIVAALRKKDPELAAIAVSGFTSDAETKRALAAGFDGHVGKPIDAVELVDAVDEAARAHMR